ncbi:hypothetical protein [Halobacillus sp. KGW1]|uniref:hypothetical protein n=1 Tax=Halobacillus sp. KGW1 TaxID=1793726 RepID=UPI0007837D76|nr:hypothetical protein [Halobacillus sp. KGW1]
MKSILRSVSLIVCAVLFFSGTFVFFQEGKGNRVIYASEKTTSIPNEIIEKADPYITITRSNGEKQEAGTADDCAGDNDPDCPYLPGDGKEIPNPGDKQYIIEDGTKPVYYQYKIDLIGLIEEVGSEQAMDIWKIVLDRNSAMKNVDFRDGTYLADTKSVKVAAVTPVTDGFSAQDVEFGENDIEFHWWGAELSLTGDMVGYLIGLGVGAAGLALGQFFPGIWVAVGTFAAESIVGLILTLNTPDPVIITYQWGGQPVVETP